MILFLLFFNIFFSLKIFSDTFLFSKNTQFFLTKNEIRYHFCPELHKIIQHLIKKVLMQKETTKDE